MFSQPIKPATIPQVRKATPDKPVYVRQASPAYREATLEQLATGAVCLIATERTEETECDKIIERAGGSIVKFSQPRDTMQTEGIADRRYRLRGTAFWFEVKAVDGELSAEQAQFLAQEHECGNVVACGTREDLRSLIHLHARSQWMEVGWQLVCDWMARGLRPEKKRPGGRKRARMRRAAARSPGGEG